MDHEPGRAVDAADALRRIERDRLRALVAGDAVAADPLHADDFWLVTPGGRLLGKAEYLGAVARGDLVYRVFEPVGEIAVRLHGAAAVLRYRSRLALGGDDADLAPADCWHTDLYERRAGRWQVVWSQATCGR